MCGRFALDEKVDELIDEFVPFDEEGGDDRELYRPAAWTPSWNIAPTQKIGVLLETRATDAPPRRRFETAHWSLIPSWSKQRRLKYPTFNARAETAASKPLFAASVVSRRAVIPANGYYEWQTRDGVKTPYFLHPEGGELLGFAGLYSWWADPAKAADDPERWLLTATILTTDTVETLADIHDRNPVMLPREQWAHWIDPTVVGDERMLADAAQAARAVASELVFNRVSPGGPLGSK